MKKKTSSANILKQHHQRNQKRKQTALHLYGENFGKLKAEYFKSFRQKCSLALRNKYQLLGIEQYNVRIVNQILFDRKTRLVCFFKEHLIYNEGAEILTKFYLLKYSKEKIDKICTIKTAFSKIYPSYFILDNKIQNVLYKNLEAKQRLIDIIEKGENREDRRRRNDFMFNPEERIFNSEFQESMEKDLKKDEEEQKMLNTVMQKKTYKRDSKDNSYNSLEIFIARMDKFEKEGEDFQEKQNLGFCNIFNVENKENLTLRETVEHNMSSQGKDENTPVNNTGFNLTSKLLTKGRNITLQNTHILENLLITGTHEIKIIKTDEELEDENGKLHKSKVLKNPNLNLFQFDPSRVSKFVDTKVLIERMLKKEAEMKHKFELIAKIQMKIKEDEKMKDKKKFTWNGRNNRGDNIQQGQLFANSNPEVKLSNLIISTNIKKELKTSSKELPDLNYKDQFIREKFMKRIEKATRVKDYSLKPFKMQDVLKDKDMYSFFSYTSRKEKSKTNLNLNKYYEKAKKEEKIKNIKSSTPSRATFYSHVRSSGSDVDPLNTGNISRVISSRVRSKQASIVPANAILIKEEKDPNTLKHLKFAKSSRNIFIQKV